MLSAITRTVLILLFFLLSTPIQAITNPQSNTPTISATVLDTSSSTQHPSSPILISPNNNSIINSNSPNFIFEPSTDSTGINKYELWIDGIFNHNISPATLLTISTTADTALTDTLHTWKIKAVNNLGNGTDSATFSFTIDTTPPIILINQIADQQLNISSQDSSSIPQDPITIQTNTPTITGSSEAQAVLTFNLESPTASYTFTTTANPDASFSLTPGFQLASDTYTVNVSSSDQASNYTSLPAFTLTITPQTSIFTAITIPKTLTAFPLTIDSAPLLTYLPWLIIFLFILYIFITKYIILYLNLVILLYLTLITLHWIPILLSLILIFLILYLKKQ